MKDLFSHVVGENNVKLNEPLSAHTTFRIGGPCDAMVFPHSVDELAAVVRICKREGLDYFVLGKGSNILVSDI